MAPREGLYGRCARFGVGCLCSVGTPSSLGPFVRRSLRNRVMRRGTRRVNRDTAAASAREICCSNTSVKPREESIRAVGRGERIRTSDPLLPKHEY